MNRNIVIISGVVIASLVGISIFFSSDIYQSRHTEKKLQWSYHADYPEQ